MEYGFDGNAETKRGNFTSTKVAPVFVRTFPEVESAVRMVDRDVIVQLNGTNVSEPSFMYADSSFVDVFAIHFLQGNSQVALDGPNNVVLTESASKKYFGDESPLGKTLVVGNDDTEYKITGVVRDYPANSQIKFDFLASFSSLGANQEETYFDANYTTYILLHKGASLPELQTKVSSFMKGEMHGSGAFVDYQLERFPTIHLHSEYPAFVPNNSMTFLFALAAVAALILGIVCFTYINLATAKSIMRAREVGVRKVVGASKAQLFIQFVSEAGVLCVVSVCLSSILSAILLPYFNGLTERQLLVKDLYSPTFIFFGVILTVFISVVAGSYPAFVLTSFQPANVLKGVFKNSVSGKWLQPSLIVFQFAISAFLIVSTFIIQEQLIFIKDKKLGFDRHHVLVLPMRRSEPSNISSIKQELRSVPHVLNISSTSSTPVRIAGGYSMRSDIMPEKDQIVVGGNPIDENYIKTTGLEIIAGNDLSEQDMRDVASANYEERTYHFILNESAVRQMGWTSENSIGKKMFMGHRSGSVKGVVRDFHFESMHSAIRPLVLFPENRSRYLLLKLDGFNLVETISLLETKWKELIPNIPFEYTFLDDEFSKLYKAEQQLGTVMNLFAVVAILLACLGLFGLSSYIMRQRTKEIAIRKILGASMVSIVNLLSSKFVKLIVLALLLAYPGAYFLMNAWLQEFAYRISISLWIFVAVGFTSLLIALLTVTIQSIRAAVVSPVESIKAE
jgi:putative ABC transport system permease protein